MVAKNVFNIDALIDTTMTRLFHLAEYVLNHCALTAGRPAAASATAPGTAPATAPSTAPAKPPGEPPATAPATAPAVPMAERVFAPSIRLPDAKKGKMVEGDLFR